MIIDKLLEEEYLLVHANTACEGLQLPSYLLTQPSVTLKLSRMFRYPVELFEKQISADLLFKGEYFSCHIPLDAIWGVTSAAGKGQIWADAIPPSLMNQITTESSEHPVVRLAPALATPALATPALATPALATPALATPPLGVASAPKEEKAKEKSAEGAEATPSIVTKGHLRRVK